jgi:probable F420-dependent oxidoreductase
MKLSLHLPMEVDQESEFENPRAVKAIAIAAERAGLHAINTTDHPAPSAKWRSHGGHDTFDPFTVLAFIAGVTERIRLHTHILVLPYRNPFVTAKAATSVDVLSEGRLILGIGSGYMRSEYSAVGSPFDKRGASMDEALEVMRLVWSGEPVSFTGSNFEAFGVIHRPRPAQKRIPIWGGGNSKRAIERAARYCDGYAPFHAPATLASTARTEALETMSDLKDKIAYLKETLDRHGRTEPFDIVGVSFVPQMKECNRTEANTLIEMIGRLTEIGCNWLVLTLPHPSLPAFLDNIQWAGEELVPRVSV